MIFLKLWERYNAYSANVVSEILEGHFDCPSFNFVLAVAEDFAIKNPKGIIAEIQKLIPRWSEIATPLGVPKNIVEKIAQDLVQL